MQKADWSGVFPAITTPFTADGAVDEEFLKKHVAWLLDAGCKGIVALGSLGEGATLTFEEKVNILEVCHTVTKGRAPLVASISGLSTAECVALARDSARVGCDGLMVLPPYVYLGDWPEIETHFSAVLSATKLSCMLYNNPIAYGTDLSANDVKTLADKHAERARGQGVERRRAAHYRGEGAPGKSAGALRRAGRHDCRGDRRRRRRLGGGTGQCAAGRSR